jgi:hypothetical protein
MPQHDHHSNRFMKFLDRFADIVQLVQLIPIGICLLTFMLALLWCVIQWIASPLFFNRWIVLSVFIVPILLAVYGFLQVYRKKPLEVQSGEFQRIGNPVLMLIFVVIFLVWVGFIITQVRIQLDRSSRVVLIVSEGIPFRPPGTFDIQQRALLCSGEIRRSSQFA